MILTIMLVVLMIIIMIACSAKLPSSTIIIVSAAREDSPCITSWPVLNVSRTMSEATRVNVLQTQHIHS